VELAMKTLPGNRKVSGLTLIEVLVVMAVIAILAALMLPVGGGPRKARIIHCSFNLKNIDGSFVSWSQTHAGKLPMQVSTNKGGTLELIQSGSACVHFLVLTNSGLTFEHHDIVAYSKDGKDLQRVNSYTNHGIELRSLICPSDERSDWRFKSFISEIAETNVSYFVGIDATLENPKSILAGDRNIQVGNLPTKQGLLTLTRSSSLGWVNGLHFTNSISGSGGNILFADDHVEYLKPKTLNADFQNQGLATNRFAIP